MVPFFTLLSQMFHMVPLTNINQEKRWQLQKDCKNICNWFVNNKSSTHFRDDKTSILSATTLQKES